MCKNTAGQTGTAFMVVWEVEYGKVRQVCRKPLGGVVFGLAFLGKKKRIELNRVFQQTAADALSKIK